jgi:glycosyltransferase involved in cell wall biosynthesis
VPVERPFISIVIPVKNDAQRLAVCLGSLKQQDYPTDRFEVIVVDNGSSDGSAKVAAESGAKVLVNPGLKVGALRNRGVAASRGSILAFVDADHELPRNWLPAGENVLLAEANIHAAGAPCVAPPRGTWVQRCWQLHRLKTKDRQRVDWLGAGNLFVRREAFDQAGGFREDLVAAEDVDLCLRLRRQGAIISEASIRNIHHGEPRTLAEFFRKEYWRGSSGIRAFVKQGFPLRELPSLLFPAYYAVSVAALLVTLLAAWRISLTPAMLVLAAIWLPGLMLAVLTSWRSKSARALLPLSLLYITYGLARAAALFKR